MMTWRGEVMWRSMVAGTPAKVVGFLEEATPALTMKHGKGGGNRFSPHFPHKSLIRVGGWWVQM